MARKEKAEASAPGAPLWMATFGDLMTNLLCFFVLLLSFSTVSESKVSQLMSSFPFQNAGGVYDGSNGVFEVGLIFNGNPEVTETVTKDDKLMKEDMKQFEESLKEYQEKNDLQLDIKYYDDGKGIKISFSDKILFAPGEADLKESSHKGLDFVASFIMKDEFKDRLVRIEGHTDNIPTKYSKYSTNWELSTARATNVLRYFTDVKNIESTRFIASGYGEFRPVESNDTEAGRAQNRRVDIVLLSKKNSADN